jgi:hypothetical protein
VYSLAFNPLFHGIWPIGLALFQSGPYTKEEWSKNFLKKYLFHGKCTSYHLSLSDFFEKALFHSVFIAFLGPTQNYPLV